jgi:hypothetical protein
MRKKICWVVLFCFLLAPFHCLAGEKKEKKVEVVQTKNGLEGMSCRLYYKSLITGNQTVTSAMLYSLAKELKKDIITKKEAEDADIICGE